MAENTYHKLNASAVNTLAQQIVNIIGLSPTTWGATAGQVTALTSTIASMDTAIENVEGARAAAKTATLAQDNLRDSLINQIAVLAKQMYAKAGLTPEQISATGLAVHDNDPSTIHPQTPTGFTATPFANGDVVFTWDRGNNPYGMQFTVQQSTDGGSNWTSVIGTKRKSAKVPGFAPGNPVLFRVFAWNANGSSTFSLWSGIYGAQAGPAGLQLAA